MVVSLRSGGTFRALELRCGSALFPRGHNSSTAARSRIAFLAPLTTTERRGKLPLGPFESADRLHLGSQIETTPGTVRGQGRERQSGGEGEAGSIAEAEAGRTRHPPEASDRRGILWLERHDLERKRR